MKTIIIEFMQVIVRETTTDEQLLANDDKLSQEGIQ